MNFSIFILIIAIRSGQTLAHVAYNHEQESHLHKRGSFTKADLNDLLRRNAEFVNRTDQTVFQAYSEGQAPGVYWISCSDSRVPMHLITGAQIGEAFSQTNIANQYDPNSAASVSGLGFAVKNLQVSDVVVVGHEGCGGCALALETATDMTEGKPINQPNTIWDKALQAWIRPIVSLAYRSLLGAKAGAPHHDRRKSWDYAEPPNKKTQNERLISQLVELNVVAQVEKIIASDIVQSTWGEGKQLGVHGWVYDITNGRLRTVTSVRERRYSQATT